MSELPITTPAAPTPTTLGEREVITVRYSFPSGAGDKTYRTAEIVYPADASEALIWERVQQAVAGLNLLQYALQATVAPTSAADAPAGLPLPAAAPAGESAPAATARPLQGGITEKQLKAIYAIARAARHLSEAEIEAQCQELYHCRPAELSKAQASHFIDSLKGQQAA
ncbi:MAG TPA: hypothetical protein VKY74_11450 [Chloroflexia bacterium]|nr:hypothetical protein [Chloroflexia bacterium]